MFGRISLSCRCADVAIGGAAINLAALIVTPVARPDIDLFHDSLSYYAVGPWAVVETIAFAAMGIASLALAFALLPLHKVSETKWNPGVILNGVKDPTHRSARSPAPKSFTPQDDSRDVLWILCSISLIVAGIASLGLVWFPMGAPSLNTPIGDLHQAAGTIGGITQLAAVLAFALATRSEACWGRLFRLAVGALLVSVAGALLSQAAILRPDLGIPMGATIRLVVISLIVLWTAVAWRLRQTCERRPNRSRVAR